MFLPAPNLKNWLPTGEWAELHSLLSIQGLYLPLPTQPNGEVVIYFATPAAW